MAGAAAGEVVSLLCLMNRLPALRELGPPIRPLKTKAESCSKQLKGWAQSLQDSDYKGERNVNRKTKRTDQAARERDEFLKELAEIRSKGAADKRNEN